MSLGPKPFRFQLMWLKHPGSPDIIKGWWDSCTIFGPPGQIFRLKLKAVRDHLRVWNKEVLRHIKVRKEKIHPKKKKKK